MRRKPLPPDRRPDWRDPNMPVLLRRRNAEGKIELYYASPEVRQRLSAQAVANAFIPDFRNDPTYNLKRKK